MITFFDSGLYYCLIRTSDHRVLGYSPDRDGAIRFAYELLADAGYTPRDIVR